MATLASYGPEWIVLAADGRYEASPGVQGHVHGLDSSHFTTGLLPRLLAGGRAH